MHRTRLPHMPASTSAWVATVAILVGVGAPHQLRAQQVQSTTPPASPSERRGFGYGAGSVVSTAVAQPAAQPAPPVTVAAASPADAVEESGIHLDAVMTRREWDATGVARLRPDERAALEEWVQKYRTELLDSAASTAQSGGVPAGDVAQSAPVAPTTGYAGQYAPVTPAPSYPPAGYEPPQSYAPSYTPGTQQPAGSQSQGPAYPPAQAYPYPSPAAQTYQPAPAQSYQPGPGPAYQPAPPPNYQPAPPPSYQPAPPQGYAPQSYPAYPPQQPVGAAAPSSVAPVPTMPYPTTPTVLPPQFLQVQPMAAAAAPNTVTAGPQSPSLSAGAVIKTGVLIQDVRGGNRFVSLSDGTMWDIYPADRGEASVWRSEDPVYVRAGTTTVSGGYDREIVNAWRNVLIRVKFVGQTGK
jgi:hypothetical protein